MGRRFLAQRRSDPYYRAAQREGLRSRAAYKLEYLAGRFPLLRAGLRVLDLGAAPGGWAMIARIRVGASGAVVAVDPRRIEPIDGVEIIRASVGDRILEERLRGRAFDTVLSDMSPAISGAYATDHARSIELASAAFSLAQTVLVPGGALAAKVFDGDLVGALERDWRGSFPRVHRTKPPVSRTRSSELYLVGIGFRPRPGSAERAREDS